MVVSVQNGSFPDRHVSEADVLGPGLFYSVDVEILCRGNSALIILSAELFLLAASN